MDRPDGPGLNTALEIVARHDPHMGPYCTAKTTTFYRLALHAPRQGAIVALGTHSGLGTVALCYGARDGHGQTVYTVDAFQRHTNWIGTSEPAETYRAPFLLLCGEAGIHPVLVPRDVLEAAAEWDAGGIGLLVWDLGVRDRAARDLQVWMRHIVPGGRVAFRDVDNRDLGSAAAIQAAVEQGWGHVQEWPHFIWSVDRPAEEAC
jgi:hypothetical protein